MATGDRFRDRFNISQALGDVGATITRVANAFRGQVPSVPLSGVTPWGTAPKNQNAKLSEQLRSAEAYFGKVTSDAGPAWTRYSTNPATDLTPIKIIDAQQSAVAGYPFIWAEMIEQALSRDGHLSGIGQQRVDDVVKGSWRLVRASPDDVAACVRNFADQSLHGVERLNDSLSWLLWGNAYCYGATETVWKRDRVTFPGPDGKIIGPVEVAIPRRLEPVHAKHFRFDLRTDEPLLWIGGDIQSLPFGKFCFYRGEGAHPIIERCGYMWPCIWYSMFRSIGWAGWATWVERYGLPTPLLTYDGDIAQYREMKTAYEDILKNLGQGLGGIVPSQNFKLEFAEPGQGGRANDPHSALSDACDSGQSIRIMGATLTSKIGNQGSFAAATTHADVKYAREESDARRLWESLGSDVIHPMVMINARELARAISEAGYPCTPADIIRRVPRGLHRVPREIDPVQRMAIVVSAVNDLGMKVGTEGLFDEFNLPQPISKDDVAPGKPTPVSSGGKSVGSVEAANEGADAPQQPQGKAPTPAQAKAKDQLDRLLQARDTILQLEASGDKVDAAEVFKLFGLPAKLLKSGKGAGGPASEAPKEPDEPGRGPGGGLLIQQDLGEAVEVLTEEDPADTFDHASQPRDANGRFAAVAGAKATVAKHIAQHLTDSGKAAEARGSTVHLKNGTKIEIGNKGERDYHGTNAKIQRAVEEHLGGHAEKHVRDWAAKTQPEPPAIRPVDTTKAGIRARKKEAKIEARSEELAAKKKERDSRRAAEGALPAAERKAAIAQRSQARKERAAKQITALKALGAPTTKSGEIDASRVPGASKTFQPLTSSDPENSFKGRSFAARSAEEMASEFGGVGNKGGTNEDIIRQQIGHLGVRDKTQWEAIAEKYEVKGGIETWPEAFKVLASKATPAGKRKPDWRNFDLETLRECPGLSELQLPPWMHAAKDHEEMHEHLARAEAEHDHTDSDDSGAYYRPPKGGDVPF